MKTKTLHHLARQFGLFAVLVATFGSTLHGWGQAPSTFRKDPAVTRAREAEFVRALQGLPKDGAATITSVFDELRSENNRLRDDIVKLRKHIPPEELKQAEKADKSEALLWEGPVRVAPDPLGKYQIKLLEVRKNDAAPQSRALSPHSYWGRVKGVYLEKRSAGQDVYLLRVSFHNMSDEIVYAHNNPITLVDSEGNSYKTAQPADNEPLDANFERDEKKEGYLIFLVPQQRRIVELRYKTGYIHKPSNTPIVYAIPFPQLGQ